MFNQNKKYVVKNIFRSFSLFGLPFLPLKNLIGNKCRSCLELNYLQATTIYKYEIFNRKKKNTFFNLSNAWIFTYHVI